MTSCPKIKRFDRTGRDVTDSPGLWSKNDCEIVQTVYPHPDITSGQHTNGGVTIWIRMPDSDKPEWVYVGTSMHRVRDGWIQAGPDLIEKARTR